jgi:hypothetical protein
MKYLTALIVALALLVPAGSAAAAEPPVPGPWQPSTAGCYKSVLERHVERRTYRLAGHTFVEFRHVASVLRWCPRSGYKAYVWRGVWGPGRR